MAETTNNFTGARMNKDIDDRLLPENEYRNAINLQISKSESSNVGALQTIRGNELVVDFNSFLGLQPNTVQCIGSFVDTENDRVFLFLTNYTDMTRGVGYSTTARNYICVHNIGQNLTKLLVQGNFLNFSTNSPVIGVNLIEGLLFWTDNRNQPRKINVDKALANTSTYYTNEDQISVAKLSPVYPIYLYQESDLEPGEFETTMKDVTSPLLPDGVANPYYDPDYIGDPTYLEDKFFRFSYRYKFEDNEYSIIAPFTQAAFIPKQDGYFLYKPDPVDPAAEPLIDDETAAFRSTVVSFMYNKVNNIILNIQLPGLATEIASLFKITEIEILCKEASSLAVEVVDSIPVSNIIENSIGDIYSYNYQSKKPFKTLPERDLLRVSDKTPIKALGQEITGNRVLYSNYQDKQSYPKYLNYNVGFKNKSPFDLENNTTSRVEYPNHSLKQNRTYQVGVVLCDRYGRQSGVILSNAFTSTDPDPAFGASTLYVPYRNTGGVTNSWPGYALSILFNDPIDGANVDGWPGLWNGDKNDPDYNPLGWYSYKIVVKQTQQDYYNTYLPGVMAAYPTNASLELNKTSHTVLLGDNINKVPRDLLDTSPNQTQYRSSVKLYSRVNNNTTDWGNQQYDPNNTFSFVNTIASAWELFDIDLSSGQVPVDSATSGYYQFYQIDSNPLIARMSTVSKIGITFLEGNGGAPDYNEENTIKLAVAETEPFDSRLDLYWESSTVGIIEELNLAIAENNGSVAFLRDWTFSLNEGMDTGETVTGDFYFTDSGDVIVDVEETDIDFKVFNNTGIELVPNPFTLVPDAVMPGVFSIETNEYFYYGYDAAAANPFRFQFTVLSGSPVIPTTFNRYGSLQNVAPSLTNYTPSNFYFTSLPIEGPDVIFTFEGENGSNPLGGNSTDNLTWDITFQGYEPYPGSGFIVPESPYYYIGSTSGIFSRPSTVTRPEHWRIDIRLTDAGGMYYDFNFEIFYSE